MTQSPDRRLLTEVTGVPRAELPTILADATAPKADISYVDAQVAARTTPADVDAQIAAGVVNKANTADLNTVSGRVSAVETEVSGRLSDTSLSSTYGRGISVKAFGAKGDGTTDDTTAITNALNSYALTGGTVYIPEGTYKISAPLPLNKWTRITGAGIDATVIKAVHTGNGFEYLGTFTASNPRRIEIQNFRLDGGTSGVGISIVAAALVDIHRVSVNGFQHNIVFQGITHGDVDKCSLLGAQKTAVWIANGSDYTAGPAIMPPQNNRISIRRCNIRSDVAGSVGVVDDGGWNHEVSNNSFEGFDTHLRVAGCEAFVASNNEYESAKVGPFVLLSDVSRAGTAVGANTSVTLADSVLDAPIDQQAVVVSGAVKSLIMSHFNFHTTAASPAVTGLDKVEKLHMILCRNWGAGALTDGSRATISHYAPGQTKSDLDLKGGRVTSDGASGADTVLFDMGNNTKDTGGTMPAFGVGRGNPSARGTLDVRGGSADTTAHGIRMLVNGVSALELLGNGAGSQVKVSDARDIVLGTTTGTKIGTAAGQKLGFYGVTPIAQRGPYAVSNPTALRSLDGSATSANTLSDVIQVLGRLITDLKATGLLG